MSTTGLCSCDCCQKFIWPEIERANKFILDQANRFGFSVESLTKNLIPYAEKYRDKMPEMRNYLAFKDFYKEFKHQKDLKMKELCNDIESTLRGGI